MKIDNKFSIGQRVWHILEPAENHGIITGLLVRSTGIVYAVTWVDLVETYSYDFELSPEMIWEDREEEEDK